MSFLSESIHHYDMRRILKTIITKFLQIFRNDNHQKIIILYFGDKCGNSASLTLFQLKMPFRGVRVIRPVASRYVLRIIRILFQRLISIKCVI